MVHAERNRRRSAWATALLVPAGRLPLRRCAHPDNGGEVVHAERNRRRSAWAPALLPRRSYVLRSTFNVIRHTSYVIRRQSHDTLEHEVTASAPHLADSRQPTAGRPLAVGRRPGWAPNAQTTRHAGTRGDGLRASPGTQPPARRQLARQSVSPSRLTPHIPGGTPGSGARCPRARPSVAAPDRRCRTPRCRPDRARGPCRGARRPALRRRAPRGSPVRRTLRAREACGACGRL